MPKFVIVTDVDSGTTSVATDKILKMALAFTHRNEPLTRIHFVTSKAVKDEHDFIDVSEDIEELTKKLNK
jgi:hypothetical protein